ncbi:MAG: type II secretion system secretin GspD [Myxococcota bacterium]
MKRLLPALLLLLLVPLGPSHAQTQPRPGDRVKLDFQNTEITDVIAMIAELTGKNFLYDQDKVSGRVTVISPTPVSIEEAYRVFESILHVRGLTTVPAPGGVLKIVQIREAKESAIETLPSDRAVPNRDLYITRLITLRYVKADTISNTLRPLISREANLIAYQPTNTLIVTDAAANIRRLVTIIDQIDVETYREQVKVLEIQYADASVLATQLQLIFSEPAGQAGRARTTARARRTTRTTPTPAAAAALVIAGVAGEPRFLTDERTNSIIVIATRAIIQQVEKLLPLLDYDRQGTGRIHVYRLQNADAEEMAQTLSSLTSAAPTTPRAPGAAAAAAIAELGQGVRVIADGPTNSLIVQASSEGYAALSEVIAALDLRRPQVMVEALILEVDVTNSEALGLAWLYQAELNTTGSALSVGVDPSGVISEPIPASTTSTGDIIAGVAATGAGLIGSTAADLTTAVLGKTININGVNLPVIQAILTASRSDSNVNIVSAPVILTADNEEAEIIIGEEIPVPTSRLQTADPSAAGGFQTSQNIARQNVGVTLRVTPQISEGDTVRLEIFQEISEVKESDPELGPTTTNRQVENTVYVRDGEAVMIGGILSEIRTTTENKVPFLGDIPILGWAFKTTSDSVRKTNLLIILTPHIVRDPDDLKRLTLERRERFRDSASQDFTAEEQEERRKALEAGVDLPYDPDPVRREFERHDRRYPVALLPDLRSQKAERDRARAAELAAAGAVESTDTYLVQAAFFHDSAAAIALLQRLIDLGYDGTILARAENGEPIHFVQLGPYASQDAAKRIAREVRYEVDVEPLVVVEPRDR